MTKTYRAVRGVSWRLKDDGWVNRETGEEVNDAPASAIKEWLASGAIEEVTLGEK